MRYGKNFANFELILVSFALNCAQAPNTEVFVVFGSASSGGFRFPVGSGETAFFSQILEWHNFISAFFLARFGGRIGNNGWKKEICILHCTLLLICCRKLGICHFPQKSTTAPQKKIKIENLTFFRVASFRIPEIWARRSVGSGVRVREVLQMQANRCPARSLPKAHPCQTSSLLTDACHEEAKKSWRRPTNHASTQGNVVFAD